MSRPVITGPHLSAAPALAGLASPGAVGPLQVGSRPVCSGPAQAKFASQQSVNLALLMTAQLATSLLQQGPSETSRPHWRKQYLRTCRTVTHSPPVLATAMCPALWDMDQAPARRSGVFWVDLVTCRQQPATLQQHASHTCTDQGDGHQAGMCTDRHAVACTTCPAFSWGSSGTSVQACWPLAS